MLKKGMFYVLFQFVCIVLLIKASSLFPISWYSIIQVIAVLLGVWSIYTARKSKLSVLPELKKGSILIKEGPYKIVRHPMYSSIIIFFIPTILLNYTTLTMVIFLALVVVLILKLAYEENMLLDELEGYKEYCKKTHRLVPFIY